MSLTPARHNFSIYAGATFRKRITLLTGDVGSDPRDLTGYTAACTIKDKPGGTTLLTLSTGAGSIQLGGVNGTVDLIIASGVTSALSWPTGQYELTITAPGPGDTDVILLGAFSVVPF